MSAEFEFLRKSLDQKGFGIAAQIVGALAIGLKKAELIPVRLDTLDNESPVDFNETLWASRTTGEVVRAWRMSRGLSQRAVADQVRTSTSYLSHFEHGRVAQPSEKRLLELARVLDIPITDILLRKLPEDYPQESSEVPQE